MSHHYATDWHQCHRCGCTFPDASLRKLQLVDTVLQLKSDVFQCLDEPRCARFKEHREGELARERQHDTVQIASNAIRPRKASP